MVPEIKFPSSNQPSKMTRRFQNTPLFKTTLIDVDIPYVTDLDIFIYFKLLYSENQAIKVDVRMEQFLQEVKITVG